ncbi:histidine phosphatase family protein [Mesorhizobium sp. CAU 1732]|uniref:SixA phosphatase family protein n=1 Tax=Mesorhizobium sp. CAU 1732 TaxID=3140358 RepID=UPI003261BF98
MDKTLLLLRHAKSSWDDKSLADFDRPLSSRGRKAAPAIGAEMARRGWFPNMAIVSPARRTRETWDLVRGEISGNVIVNYDASIYEADADVILDVIRATPEQVGTLLVVGHNPGMEDLAGIIAGATSDVSARASLSEKFPTGGLARFSIHAGWHELHGDSATLTDFITPRSVIHRG